MLAAHDRACVGHEGPHALEVALAAQRLRGSGLPWRGCGRARPGRRSRRGPRPAARASGGPASAHGGSCASSTAVRRAWPRCSAPGDVGRRLDDHERRLGRVGATCPRRRARRRRPPASARRSRGSTSAGRYAFAAHRCRWRRRQVARRLPENKTPRSSSGRTGSWYHLLVRPPGACPRSSRPPDAGRPGAPRGALSGATRTARERRSRPLSAAGFQPMARVSGRPSGALLLSVSAVKGASVARGPAAQAVSRWRRAS